MTDKDQKANYRILLVEDDASLGQNLSERLSKDYQVRWENTFETAWQHIQNKPIYDLIILDVNLPDGNGFDLAKKIQQFRASPFIFLTAQSDPEARLTGFELGAEEYIPKPFHLKELLIRVQHVLNSHVPTRELATKHAFIDFSNRSIRSLNGKISFPSTSDMKLLQVLVDGAPKVLSRDEIMDKVWGVDTNLSHRTIDNIILRLRQLLGNEAYIRSVRGVGYQWNPSLEGKNDNLDEERD